MVQLIGVLKKEHKNKIKTSCFSFNKIVTLQTSYYIEYVLD